MQWRIVGADELDGAPRIRRHTVQVEEARFDHEGEPPDFINHSAEPNAGLEQIAIVALQRIQPGDEVTIDYAMSWSSECSCGSAICVVSHRDDWRNPMLWSATPGAFLALSRAPHQGSQATALPPHRGLVAVGTEATGNTGRV